MNATETRFVSVATSKTTRRGAERAVVRYARLVKAKIQYPSGIGEKSIVFLKRTKPWPASICMFAKNGAVVIVVVGSHQAALLTHEAVALAKIAASRT
jgi:hypothetical protein